ncbi:autotransporter assembly complex protein TamA [Paraglaciecola arctica]|uniref:autotransporter assembly complex protein TamA n=1 Tax=Paraglaciecola arctica TaxID=1128911 RepID=UPI0020916392|nr:autotransporter assembly complex family protein [Paraglaciecola arctica]
MSLNIPLLKSLNLLIIMLLMCCKVHAAEIDIKGLEDPRILKNVKAHIETLEVPSAIYQFSQYQESLQSKVSTATQVFGYYQTTTTITPPSTVNKNWQMLIDLGAVTRLREVSIRLNGQGEQDSKIQSLLSSIKLKQGQPLEHSIYENAKKDLQSLALSLGYFDFEFEENSIKVFESSRSADISLQINTGERYKFAELRFGNDVRSQQLIKNLAPFKAGDLYQASQLGLLSQRLKQTQYFRQVVVRPLVAEAVDTAVPVQVILTHKAKDNFDVGVGFSSDVGPRFTGKWKRPWVNASGHSIGAEVFVSSPEQYVTLDYRVPLEDAIQNYLSYQAGYQAQNDNDTSSHKWSVSATRHWTVENSDWQRSAFIRLEQETFIQGLESEQTTRLLTPGLSLSRLRSRGGLDIYWGDKQSITTEFASESLLSDINMVRVTAATKWVRSIQEHRFLWRAEIGGIVTNDFSQVPSSLRFFTGGDQSVRGFDYKTLSPFELDSDGERELIGGQYLAVASLEYSYPVAENWRAAAFVDAGNANDELFEDPAIGIGVGAIWSSPIGPVRLYLAKGESDFGSTRYLHISMGPSL